MKFQSYVPRGKRAWAISTPRTKAMLESSASMRVVAMGGEQTSRTGHAKSALRPERLLPDRPLAKLNLGC
jgi:hypothetical protein